MPWRREWQPPPVLLTGKSHGWGSLVGCHLWGRTGSDTTEGTQQQQQQLSLVEFLGTWGCVSEQDTMDSSQGKPLPYVLWLPLVCINKTFRVTKAWLKNWWLKVMWTCSDRSSSWTRRTGNNWQFTVINVAFVISIEDLASEPGTRLDYSRSFV